MRAMPLLLALALLAPANAAVAGAPGDRGATDGAACQGLPGTVEACDCPGGFVFGISLRILGRESAVCFF